MFAYIPDRHFVYPQKELLLTIIQLTEWSLVHITGDDSKKYLQNQLTIDLNLLSNNNHVLCAHCNFNGKVWSTMHLFHYETGYAYIQRKSVSDIQIKELKKYSTFSNVEINQLKKIFLIGIAGKNARLFLLDLFEKVPSNKQFVMHNCEQSILRFLQPSERFLLIFSSERFTFFKNSIDKKIFFSNSKQWTLLDMESGFPIIENQSAQMFFPQAINLEKLNGISLHKGCFYGQEMIARIFFKKLNKRFLCLLVGIGNIFPKIGSIVEIFIKNKWCKIGVLLYAIHVKFQEIWIQVVLNGMINKNSIFRIRGLNSIFLIPKS
ncbi:MAG: tRNA-modifying protein YgfZ [Buchnera aphidicola (Pentalonia nigronervosa)]|uniref:tRNA-modifying protein YgfZ n=1 Tax=Buchnera aphidicola (Pentalonia nigronervosa) TaxID=1309793 RepID=A0A7H1AYS6_9GAMM|nr:MAG: tRNA-modifying protein YgfZ [Buchnera aphidicola (Pentalonia nigronervosa)]